MPSTKADLGPRLINHNETQAAYYERQLEIVQRDLARISLIYSGQLSFDFAPTEPA